MFAYPILSTRANRIVWVDVLKGTLLLFICISHFEYVPSVINPVIIQTSSFWVPIFFVLSGYLFVMRKSDTIGSYIRKKNRSLLFPYLFFCVLFIFLDPNTYTLSDSFKHNIHRMLCCGSGVEKATPLWFVLSLFISSILAFIVLHFTKHLSILIAIVIAAFVLVQPQLEPNGAYMWIIALSAVVYIISGYYLKVFLVYFEAWHFFFKIMLLSVSLLLGLYDIFGNNIADFHLNVINNYPPPHCFTYHLLVSLSF